MIFLPSLYSTRALPHRLAHPNAVESRRSARAPWTGPLATLSESRGPQATLKDLPSSALIHVCARAEPRSLQRPRFAQRGRDRDPGACPAGGGEVWSRCGFGTGVIAAKERCVVEGPSDTATSTSAAAAAPRLPSAHCDGRERAAMEAQPDASLGNREESNSDSEVRKGREQGGRLPPLPPAWFQPLSGRTIISLYTHSARTSACIPAGTPRFVHVKTVRVCPSPAVPIRVNAASCALKRTPRTQSSTGIVLLLSIFADTRQSTESAQDGTHFVAHFARGR
ncbi:hypothetical protein C8R45DRAFT_920320 [Mycena sanguinolenta]|nr:hypothetical protein C8R45DRAFT_920320 [Mycena sanguinolenta]